EQDAEREQARERRDVSPDERRRDHDPRRDRRGGGDRLRRHVRTPAEAPEAARQLTVLAERVRESREARDRGRDRDEEDERTRGADVEPERAAQPPRQLMVE